MPCLFVSAAPHYLRLDSLSVCPPTDLSTAYQTKLRLDWKTGVAATDWNAIAKKEHLDALTVELRKLEDNIREVYSDMLQLQQREQAMREISGGWCLVGQGRRVGWRHCRSGQDKRLHHGLTARAGQCRNPRSVQGVTKPLHHAHAVAQRLVAAHPLTFARLGLESQMRVQGVTDCSDGSCDDLQCGRSTQLTCMPVLGSRVCNVSVFNISSPQTL